MLFRQNNVDVLRVAAKQIKAKRRHYWLVMTCLLFMLAAAGRLSAQIEVGVELEHAAYLTGEAFTVRVQIENKLDVPLVLDDHYHNAELMIELIGTHSGVAPEGERRPVSRDSVIMPAQKAMELVEVTSLFPLKEPGGYRIRAAIRYGGRLYLSQPVAFDLVRGVEICSARRGLPGYSEITLLYSLRFWKRSGSEHAFLVIEDAGSGVIYGTFILGPIVRVTPPVILFDADGRAVVVHQSGRNRFTRSVIAVDHGGATLTAQTHHREDGSIYPTKAAPR